MRYGIDVFPVRTFEFQKTIEDICVQRGDDWADKVLGRIQSTNDLHVTHMLTGKELSEVTS